MTFVPAHRWLYVGLATILLNLLVALWYAARAWYRAKHAVTRPFLLSPSGRKPQPLTRSL